MDTLTTPEFTHNVIIQKLQTPCQILRNKSYSSETASTDTVKNSAIINTRKNSAVINTGRKQDTTQAETQ